jgi:hypothetical protein
VILVGCEDTGAMAAMMEMGMDEDAAEEACLEIRADGVSVDIDGDYTETLARINANPEGHRRLRSGVLREQHRPPAGRHDVGCRAHRRHDLDR